MQAKIKPFAKTCKQDGLGVNFEYTATGMLQQNGCIEHKFATLFNRVRAMLNGGKFTTYLQSGLWAEAANTDMLLKNHLINFLGRDCPSFDAKIW